jgi:putative ABC transport system permease protein
MFKNYCTIAYRNLLRHKEYTLINITGLAMGMVCCLLITFYVRHELYYDRYHANADRIYRVVHGYRQVQGNKTYLPSPRPRVWGNASVGPALEADFPEVKKVVQFTSPNSLLH